MSETDDLRQPAPDEANEADAAEQRAAVGEEERVERGPIPDEADEADAAEQRREVRLDEDDYR